MASKPIWRDSHGVPHIGAQDQLEAWRRLGWCHARDRALQMLLMRLAGEGRVSEIFATDETLELDLFFRRMNFYAPSRESLSDRAAQLCDAYCQGVNACLARHLPWELRLVGYRPRPWTHGDILLLSRMMGYVMLAEGHAEIERLIVEIVQAGVDRPRLQTLFPGMLDGLDEELLRKVKLTRRVIPEMLWQVAAPGSGSNNWVVSGTKTASGKPMLANDPHLEGSRLPNVWYEVVMRWGSQWMMGATVPGLPAIIVGRTAHLAWGVTYAFVDAVDSWIEHCREGKYLRDDRWHDFVVRKEVIHRKRKPPVEATFYENEHGVLDGSPLDEGYYLATRWSAGESGVQSVEAFTGLIDARNVEEGMSLLGRVETAWNWVLCDAEGNIGYQMSGLAPRRRDGSSGLVPLPGWDPANDWRGFASHEDLPRCMNPTSGYILTANHDLNVLGRFKPINIAVGPDRADRIDQLLRDAKNLTPADMQRMQYDVLSLQAQRWMKVLSPLLPETPQGRILKNWDCRYATDSRGAFLFERVYTGLVRHVLGNALGEKVAENLISRPAFFAVFYSNFDRALLEEDSPWLPNHQRDELFRGVIARQLDVEPIPWGEHQRMDLRHIFFRGKTPRLLGFDRGPVPVRGGRATIHQGQVLKRDGRVVGLVPGIHVVIDMVEDGLWSNLLGGPSDRRFSRWYASEIDAWIDGKYKRLTLG